MHATDGIMPGILENIRNGLRALSVRQKTQLVVALVATVAIVWGVAQFATRVRYGVLFTRLDTNDAADVVAALKERGLPYRLTRGGRAIEIPSGQVDELRMELAGEGLPRGGGVGFEIFDKPSFGLSDFVQNVNYRRALERELGRSIQSIDAVEAARVHLALPPESVFANEKNEASASVVLRLRSGSPLPVQRVRAIAHLVASGVEGLESTRVSVIDGQGRMLTNAGDDEGASLSATQLEMKAAMEERVESILLAILEPVVGVGKARARATVELETARVERVEETFDPDGAVVRSEQKNRSKSRGSGPGGVPGTASNLPGGSTAAASAGGSEETQTVTTNFEINKSVSTIAEPRGSLIRQFVAVVVDHASAPSEDDPGGPRTAVARTDEEMEQITDLVRAAVGIDEARGDVLTVENISFDETLVPVETGQGFDWVGLVLQILRYGAVPLAVLLIALLVIRPGIAALRAMQPAGGAGASPPTVAELQASLGQSGGPPLEGRAGLRQKLIEAAATDPQAAALVVRGWLDRRKGG
jgi:flagellar M-ring protein FliF